MGSQRKGRRVGFGEDVGGVLHETSVGFGLGPGEWQTFRSIESLAQHY